MDKIRETVLKIITYLFTLLLSTNIFALEVLHVPDEWISGNPGVEANRKNVGLAWQKKHDPVKPATGHRVLAVFARSIQQEFYNSGLFGGYTWNPDSEAKPWSESSSSGGSGGCLIPDTDCDYDPGQYCPLLIDLNGDEVHLGSSNESVSFDLFGNGDYQLTQWTAPASDDAFLVMDNNRNGVVDNGSELFGQGSDFVSKAVFCQNSSWLDAIGKNLSVSCGSDLLSLKDNGFSALAQYDLSILGGNQDGVISHEDQVWSRLLIWLDTNADGQTTVDEIKSLQAYGLYEISLSPKKSYRQDSSGNQIPLWSWSHINLDNKHKRLKVLDVYFNLLQ